MDNKSDEVIEPTLMLRKKSDLEKRISEIKGSKFTLFDRSKRTQIEDVIYNFCEELYLYMKLEKNTYHCWSTEWKNTYDGNKWKNTYDGCYFQLELIETQHEDEKVVALFFNPKSGMCGKMKEELFVLLEEFEEEDGEENTEESKGFGEVDAREIEKNLTKGSELNVLETLISIKDNEKITLDFDAKYWNYVLKAMVRFKNDPQIMTIGGDLLNALTKENRTKTNKANIDLELENVFSLAEHWFFKVSDEKNKNKYIPGDISSTLAFIIQQTRGGDIIKTLDMVKANSDILPRKAEELIDSLYMHVSNSKKPSDWTDKEVKQYTEIYFGKHESIKMGEVKDFKTLTEVVPPGQLTDKFKEFIEMLGDLDDVLAKEREGGDCRGIASDPTRTLGLKPTRGLKPKFSYADFYSKPAPTKSNDPAKEESNSAFGTPKTVDERLLSFCWKFAKAVKIEDVWKSITNTLNDVNIDFKEDKRNTKFVLHAFEASVFVCSYLQFFTLATGTLALEMLRISGDGMLGLDTYKEVDKGFERDEIILREEKAEKDAGKKELNTGEKELDTVTGDTDDDGLDAGGESDNDFLNFEHDEELIDDFVEDLTRKNVKNKREAAIILAWNIKEDKNRKLILDKSGSKLMKTCTSIIASSTTDYILMVKCLEILHTLFLNGESIDTKSVLTAHEKYSDQSKEISEIDSRMMGSNRVETLFKNLLK